MPGGESAHRANRVQPGKTTFAAGADNDVIRAAVRDVNAFWAREFPKLSPGQKYEKLPLQRAIPYGPDDPPPACGGEGAGEYRAMARNAFYCPAGDFIAWDHAQLTPLLLREFGPFTLGIVVAHELGHRVQAKEGILDGRFATFVTEQQADCFAGAWTRHVVEGGSDSFTIRLQDLDGAMGGFLAIRDPVGTSPVDPRAHGSAFQRITAFEDGLKRGVSRCKSYEAGALEFVPETFNDEADVTTGGNLPLDQARAALLANLTGFWRIAVEGFGSTWTDPNLRPFDPAQGVGCGAVSLAGDRALGLYFYCRPDDSVSWDDARLVPAVHAQIGDLGVGTILGTLFSVRASFLAGMPPTTLAGNLRADCFTGVWAATAKTGELAASLPPGAQLQLSPGDLDEAVAALLQFDRKSVVLPPDDAVPTGSGFLRVDSFHTGFLEAFDRGMGAGLSTCVDRARAAGG